MTENDKKRFAAIMAGMAESFNASISTPGLQVRFAAMEEFTIEQIEQACVSCIKSRRFSAMPTVGEIIEFISGGRVEDVAEVEAAKVWKAVTEYGAYRDIVFDDAVTQAVIEYGFGGWTKMCGELKVDEQKWFLKEFCRMYGSYSRQNVRRGGVLTGLAVNKSPVLIGDPAKAALVMADTPREITGPVSTANLLGAA